ncbi:MAG: MerR family transcriptional regulator [Pseudomonadota bacterium]
MVAKSADAFRTISEVAEWLGVQTHVLRFWESKFSQVKPVKRAGGRRYYRPADMLLLGGIRKLLHEDGMTIKGVQKILREEGMAHVADMSPPLDDITAAQVDGDLVADVSALEAELAPPAEDAPVPEPCRACARACD